MNDKQLVAAAAKAIGRDINTSAWEGLDDDGTHWRDISGGGDGTRFDRWNPLTDDGDALRLAVRLEIDLCFGADYVIADGVQEPTVNNANDPFAATRYAIVRAAAELGMTPNVGGEAHAPRTDL